MKIRIMVFGMLTGLLTACASDGTGKNVSSAEKAQNYLQLGINYMSMGELKFAKENLEKALDYDSSNPEIHNAAAAMYERIKESENAKSHYQTAVRLDPENPQSQNNYGRFLCESGDVAEGLEHLNKALSMPLNDRLWFALTNAGRCLLKQGQKTQAESYFKEALAVQTDYPPALLEMLKMYFTDGRYLSAKAFAQRYQNSAAFTPEFLWYAMQIEQALGHRTAAQQYKKSLLNQFPSSDEAKRVSTSISND